MEIYILSSTWMRSPNFHLARLQLSQRPKLPEDSLVIFSTWVETWFEIPHGGQFCKNFHQSLDCNNWVIWIRFGKAYSRLTEWGFWSLAILAPSILFFVLPHYKMGYWNWLVCWYVSFFFPFLFLFLFYSLHLSP